MKLVSRIVILGLLVILPAWQLDNAQAQPGRRLRELRAQRELSNETTNPEASGESATEQTTVRVIGKPTGTWRTWQGGLTRLIQSEVTLKNTGGVEAMGVRVTLNVPGGAKLAMFGPRTLAPNATGTYHSNQNVDAESEKELSADVSCANCR